MKKPKFECDKLEYQNSGNHLEENPEVLSRLGHQAGSTETKVSAAKLHNTGGATQMSWLEKGILRDKLNTLQDTSFRKVSAIIERTAGRFSRKKPDRKVRGKGQLERENRKPVAITVTWHGK